MLIHRFPQFEAPLRVRSLQEILQSFMMDAYFISLEEHRLKNTYAGNRRAALQIVGQKEIMQHGLSSLYRGVAVAQKDTNIYATIDLLSMLNPVFIKTLDYTFTKDIRCMLWGIYWKMRCMIPR